MRMIPDSRRSTPVSARASGVRPEPSRPARPSTSPSARSRSASAMPGAGGDAACAEERGPVTLGVPRRQGWRGSWRRCDPASSATRSMRSSSLGPVLADERAVAQDGDAVADLVDLVEEVRDEQDGDAALLELADHAEELGHLVEVQARRRLVEHEHLDVGGDRPRDRDQLLHGQRSGCPGSRRDRCRAPVRRATARAFATHAAPVDQAEPARLATERDVLGHRHVRQQVDLLVDRADARAAGRRGGWRSRTTCPVEPELARRPAAGRP